MVAPQAAIEACVKEPKPWNLQKTDKQNKNWLELGFLFKRPLTNHEARNHELVVMMLPQLFVVSAGISLRCVTSWSTTHVLVMLRSKRVIGITRFGNVAM